jgi:hypothetical protein
MSGSGDIFLNFPLHGSLADSDPLPRRRVYEISSERAPIIGHPSRPRHWRNEEEDNGMRTPKRTPSE